jgi:hypothetical protein
MASGKVEKLEKRAAEIVEQARQLNVCALQLIEFFGGVDDGGNRTFDYWQGLGFPLERTRDALSEAVEDDVFGVYAVWDGIVVQCHASILNDQGNPVKDYGWVIHLSVLLAEEKIPEDKILPALEEDIGELERRLEALKGKPVTSHRVEKPYGGYAIAFCPICSRVLKPSCRDIQPLSDVLVYNHEHQPVFIVLSEAERKRQVKYSGAPAEGYQDLFELVQTLWLSQRESPRAIERMVDLWLSLKRPGEAGTA